MDGRRKVRKAERKTDPLSFSAELLRDVFRVSLEFREFRWSCDSPAGQDAGGGEEDDGNRVGGAQQTVPVEGGRDVLAEPLSDRHHPGGRRSKVSWQPSGSCVPTGQHRSSSGHLTHTHTHRNTPLINAKYK